LNAAIRPIDSFRYLSPASVTIVKTMIAMAPRHPVPWAPLRRPLGEATVALSVVAASTDPIEKAKETVSEHSLTLPGGYGLPLTETAATLGAFYEERRGFVQATGFVIKPDKTIAIAQYSSGPIGRLVWQDILGLVQFYKKQAK